MDELFAALGRRGGWSVVVALRDGAPTTLRSLARQASVPLSSVARVVSDLETLGVVDKLRPGRDAQIQWRSGPIADWVAALQPPDVAAAVEATFTGAYDGPGTVLRWGEGIPTQIAILTQDEDAAWDAVGDALDAVDAAGWPAPELLVQDPDSLEPSDPLSAAILRSLQGS